MLKKCAFIFPGQGAQYVGMGKELSESFKTARETYDMANEVLGFDIKRLIFTGPKEELIKTKNSQPAIFITSIAALTVLNSKHKNIPLTHVAGLSLGEYSALVAAGSIRFDDALKLVRARGVFMEQAAFENQGKMLSIIGLDLDKIKDICEQTGAEIANLNCPGQVVVSLKEQIADKVKILSQQAGAQRVVVLNVSGPFHSSLMKSSSTNLANVLKNIEITYPRIKFIANVTATPLNDPLEIKHALITQVTHTTYWEKSMRLMITAGVKRYYEIGPGKVLKGLMRMIDRNVEVINIEKPEDISNVMDVDSVKSLR
ncbi:MAG: ACP S-malonyltransferase [Candidatus Omnitrophota bacterium]